MDKTDLIKNTLDFKYYKTQLILMIAISPLMILILLLGFFSPKKEAVVIPVILFLLLYIPMIIYCIYKLKSIKKEPERYDIYKATAIKAHHAFGMSKGSMYFEIKVKNPDGNTFFLETNSVFSRGVLSNKYYGNFVQQEIDILYDRVTGTVLVLDNFDL